MQFMAPVTVPCEECQGRRFRPEVLAVRFRGRNIAETLELTVDSALVAFADQRRLCRRLRTLARGRSRLPAPRSAHLHPLGGEAQRLKLASFLDRPATLGRQLFLFDEPTTGLHLSDIDLLYHTLRRLVQRGDGVVVVEHSPDLIARADWIVDLGPGGGAHGGELLYSGPIEPFLEQVESPTADELRRHLEVALSGGAGLGGGAVSRLGGAERQGGLAPPLYPLCYNWSLDSMIFNPRTLRAADRSWR